MIVPHCSIISFYFLFRAAVNNNIVFFTQSIKNPDIRTQDFEEIRENYILYLLNAPTYEDTYSFWVFRTGFQDGPSSESSVKSIEPIGKNWYRVAYSDMGNPGITDVQVQSDKICAYKSQNNIE